LAGGSGKDLSYLWHHLLNNYDYKQFFCFVCKKSRKLAGSTMKKGDTPKELASFALHAPVVIQNTFVV
jgi:hypothetical protein